MYETHTVLMGAYKHHQGSSSSKSGKSWIEEIRRAWGLEKGHHIDCAAAGCPNDTSTHSFEGCHLAESRLKEILNVIGFGGTPVVALCSACHNKTGAAIVIGNAGLGIIDDGCPPDIREPSTEIDWGAHILCNSCGTVDTKGPDEDDDWYCATCEHHIDSEGNCSTDNCCEDDEDDDDDEDDYDDYDDDDDDDSESTCPWCEDEGHLVLENEDYGGQRVYTCCSVYFDEDGDLYPSENPMGEGICRCCGENQCADDCGKELCGSCCDGDCGSYNHP